jgi:ech hydrogenase subunit F
MKLFTIHKILFRSLFSKPFTEKYPFGPKKEVPRARGSIRIEIKDCIYCGICQKKCPTRANLVSKEAKRWAIDRMQCISCGACVDTCPKKCLFMDENYSAPAEKSTKDTYSGA